jgi:hypothetical protein
LVPLPAQNIEPSMGETKRLAWEIAFMRKAIDLDWVNLAAQNISPARRKVLTEHLTMSISSLKQLHIRLQHLSKGRPQITPRTK